MKTYKTLLIPLIASMLLIGCNKKDKGESEEPKGNIYNIIMTAATIPPVVSALESIVNGGKTYAYIERGKTYAGIAELEENNIYNLGFDPATNLASGVTKDAFDAITAKVKEIKAEDEKAIFNIFTTDYKPWAAVKVASDAKLSLDNFTIYMVEDGTATYVHANKDFIKKFNTAHEADAYYDEAKAKSLDLFERAMQSSTVIDEMKNGYVELYPDTFTLSSHKNFVHLMQDETKMESSLNKFNTSKIYQSYLGEKRDNVVYKSISQRVASLNENQKDVYLRLMFGQYKEESYRLLTRTKNDKSEDNVPTKKLIYIGTRVIGSDLKLIDDVTSIPESFDNLSYSLREFFLNEEDFNIVKEYLNNEANYLDDFKDGGSEVINKVKVAAFNNYIGFAYNLKIAKRLYGDKYDILFKGHPGETFESIESWTRYKLTVNEVEYTYNKFMYHLAKLFHESDSEGKFIGVLPAGVAAENLAYLGINTYVGGLPSSTYTGYEKSAPILFVFNNIDGDINADGNINQRYIDGELSWNDDGETINTTFFNNGVFYKLLRDYYKSFDSAVYNGVSLSYQNRLNAWLKKVIKVDDISGCDVDLNGSPILTETVLEKARTVRKEEAEALVTSYDLSSLDNEQKEAINNFYLEAVAAIDETESIYFMDKAVSDLKVNIDNFLGIEE